MTTTNILKAPIVTLDPAPLPNADTILQIRTGKTQTLGQDGQQSSIFKQAQSGRVYASRSGLESDTHVYPPHNSPDRAVNQYDSTHYAAWRTERPNQAALFQYGGFGENIVASGELTETNVCIGDVFRVGSADAESDEDVLLQISEPRSPCYKLNLRFEHPTTQRSVVRTGRTGWNYRVLRAGYVEKGMVVELKERRNPRWSVRNVQKVVGGRDVESSLLEEVMEMEVITEFYRDLAERRLETATRTYRLVQAEMVTLRVRKLTFELANSTKTIKNVNFKPFANAQIKFGPRNTYSRSYSIVDGDLTRFSLGVALDEHSRGGSKYLHDSMKVGNEIKMAPGIDALNAESEVICEKANITNRIVIIGGIGVTAFLPAIQHWTQRDQPFEIHYAVRSLADAPFTDMLPPDQTTIYAKAEGQRLDIDNIIPGPDVDGNFSTRIFVCGPQRLMDACKARTTLLGYPKHLLHFESFGTSSGVSLGEPFSVSVTEVDCSRKVPLDVPSDKTLLQVLIDAGFDVLSNCQAGGCGSCKVNVKCGMEKVRHGTELGETLGKREGALLSCVDRAVGRVEIEVD